MPSSLTWFLPRTLVCSTHPPVSVCGTVRTAVPLRTFLGGSARRLRRGGTRGSALRHRNPMTGALRLPLCEGTPYGCRNVRLLSIGYALPPRLRGRLTLGGRTWPRKPRIYGGVDSRHPCRYSCLHGRPHPLHGRSRSRFGANAALSYRRTRGASRDFGYALQSRSFSARGHSASGLLRGLQMVAASEPTSWLSARPHILTIH